MGEEELQPADPALRKAVLRVSLRPAKFPGPSGQPPNFDDWGWCSTLIVGAGGLGCELLHCMALMGFQSIHLIDMDIVDLSNLNRQFLFRDSDIGKPKSLAAADYINKKYPWMRVTAHHCRMEEKDDDFFRQFYLVILGLDSVNARQWANRKFASLNTVAVDDDGKIVLANAPPLIDGGTEGFQGSCRVVQWGQTPCIACEDLYPKVKTVPMCTLENVPRIPEHCILYVKLKTFEDEKPFGATKDANGQPIAVFDGDEPEHIKWITVRARDRQAQFKISGNIDFQMTQRVVKNSIAAVGFTNALVAAMCVNEAVKLLTGAGPTMMGFLNYNGGAGGAGANVTPMRPNSLCSVCQVPKRIMCDKSWTSTDLVTKGIFPLFKELQSNYVVDGAVDVATLVNDVQVLSLLSSTPTWVRKSGAGAGGAVDAATVHETLRAVAINERKDENADEVVALSIAEVTCPKLLCRVAVTGGRESLVLKIALAF